MAEFHGLRHLRKMALTIEEEDGEEADAYQLLAVHVVARAVKDALGLQSDHAGDELDGRKFPNRQARDYVNSHERVSERAWAWLTARYQGPYSFTWWCEAAGITKPKRKGVPTWRKRYIQWQNARRSRARIKCS